MTKEIKPINPVPSTATAKEVSEIGRIVYDVFDEGIRFIIMRGPYHWCAYIGIPVEHPLAGMSYDDMSINAHGGLTFSAKGGGKKKNEEDILWPEGYWWYGWDYGHSGDYSHFEHRPEKMMEDDKDWTIDEVIKDSMDTIYDFKKLLKLAGKIKLK
ncbi:hypothetical protein A3F59_02670 [Candidatus Roizmanbacteria bacterium RIFCSPHIGHO2_12_FULL_38_13]|nr:MAG: hypothetical protein A3F59_02670 [Candidatus Roizmanbacteria bacterium RIFCSPHIGHO2_12_FULL_38_13]